MHTPESPIFETSFSELSKAYLLDTTRWSKFLAIFGFIGSALMLLLSIGMLAAGAMMQQSLNQIGQGYLYYIYIVVLPISTLLNIYLSYLLYNFSTKLKSGLESNNVALIEAGLKSQKTLYKTISMLVILSLVFYVLVIALAVTQLV